MKLFPSSNFENTLIPLTRSDLSLKKQVIKALCLLQENVHHPSLRLHKLSGTEIYSILVNMSIRIVFKKSKDCFYLLDIGKHEEVY